MKKRDKEKMKDLIVRERKMKSRVNLAHKIYGIRRSGPFRVHTEKFSGNRQTFDDEPLIGVLMPR